MLLCCCTFWLVSGGGHSVCRTWRVDGVGRPSDLQKSKWARFVGEWAFKWRIFYLFLTLHLSFMRAVFFLLGFGSRSLWKTRSYLIFNTDWNQYLIDHFARETRVRPATFMFLKRSRFTLSWVHVFQGELIVCSVNSLYLDLAFKKHKPVPCIKFSPLIWNCLLCTRNNIDLSNALLSSFFHLSWGDLKACSVNTSCLDLVF